MLERAVPLVLLAAAGVYLALAWSLPFGGGARPGPGFYPVLVAIFAVVVGLAAAVSAFRAPTRISSDGPELEAPARRRVMMSVAALAAFCFAMPWIGYPAAAFGFVAIVLRALGSRWTTALVAALLSAAGSYGVFAGLLDVPLPRGPW